MLMRIIWKFGLSVSRGMCGLPTNKIHRPVKRKKSFDGVENSNECEYRTLGEKWNPKRKNQKNSKQDYVKLVNDISL